MPGQGYTGNFAKVNGGGFLTVLHVALKLRRDAVAARSDVTRGV
jgi:hypothetical protein